MTTAEPAPLSQQDTTDPAVVPVQRVEPPGWPYAPGYAAWHAQQPTEPPKRSRLKGVAPLTLVLVVVAGVIAGTVYLHNSRTAGAPGPVAGSVECDPSLVEVHPMINGVALRVTAQGPTVVGVDVWDTFTHRRLTQQVTKHGDGAEFALWDITGVFRRVTVGVRGQGSCDVPASVIEQLNH